MKTKLQHHLENELDREFLNKNIFFNKNISKQTWFGVGGLAEVLFIPQSSKDLIKVLKLINTNTTINVIGLGSNILIRDGGLNGITIRLSKNFNFINENDESIVSGAAVPDKVFSKYCYEKSITDCEFLYGIPGTIGGAIAMNAGCYGSEISDVVYSFKCIDFEGNETIIKNSEQTFSYRKNNFLKNHIVTEVEIKKNHGDKDQIKEKMNDINARRLDSQPQKVRTGGSTFKNPTSQVTDKKTWELIKPYLNEVVCPDGVSMSKKHANFIINTQTKSSNIIEDFGERIIEKVLEKTGVQLEWEIQIKGQR
jgi:UDP-N-acetylmuramate dehydrogenase|tara:strand:+ start:1 stop:930 length:930 start_codon:yes stop_codon:yes gene_type:complete